MNTCAMCDGSGFVIDRQRREWDVCTCPAGQLLSADLDISRADIAAGRLVRWEDVKRTQDRLSRMAAGYFG